MRESRLLPTLGGGVSEATCDVILSSPSTFATAAAVPTQVERSLSQARTSRRYFHQRQSLIWRGNMHLYLQMMPSSSATKCPRATHHQAQRFKTMMVPSGRCYRHILARSYSYRARGTLITLSTNSERAQWAEVGASPWRPGSIDPWGLNSDTWPLRTNLSELRLELLNAADNFIQLIAAGSPRWCQWRRITNSSRTHSGLVGTSAESGQGHLQASESG